MISQRQPGWLHEVLEGLRLNGFAVVVDVLGAQEIEALRPALYAGRDRIEAEIGRDRLARAGEVGVLRLLLKGDELFFRLLELPALLAVVDATVSNTAVLHLQNGFILPPLAADQGPPDVFQLRFHQDFPRVLGGYLASVNCLFAVDAFEASNGATLVVPGSHQRQPAPSPEYMQRHCVPVTCPAGAMIVFDSTLWHAAGANRSGRARLAINHQFTRSFIKQQIDYVRALGDDVVLSQRPRTQQLLGWYTRVVTSLDEYYQPEDKRLYRKGQG